MIPELPQSILRIREMSDSQAAHYLSNRLIAMERDWKLGFIERGLILLNVQSRELWRLMNNSEGKPYHSFENWVTTCAPQSRRDCFAALAAVKELQDVPLEHLAEISRCNIIQLQHLSTSIRSTPEVLEAAKTLTEEAFAEHIEVRHPDQHHERPVKPTLRLTKPVQDALDLVGRLMSVDDRQGQLEALCADFLIEHSYGEPDGTR